MLIIPAIDIKDGKCIRLKQGRIEETTVYSEAPELVAREWERQGAELIHIVDIDGAIKGRPSNKEEIARILEETNVPVELGGGIRDMETLEFYMDMGVDRVILGTVALMDTSFVKETCKRFPDKIAVSIDAKDGMVAVKGWQEVTEKKAIDIAKVFEDIGVTAIIYTDISRDGMMMGPNIPAIKAMHDALKIPLIASGGISSIEDIRELNDRIEGLEGIIVGKALYAGAFKLADAIKAVESH